MDAAEIFIVCLASLLYHRYSDIDWQRRLAYCWLQHGKRRGAKEGKHCTFTYCHGNNLLAVSRVCFADSIFNVSSTKKLY